MEYVIGIDGGATKTHCAAFDREMTVLGEAFGGSSNLTSLSREQVRGNLRELLARFFQESGLSPRDCACLCLGSAGAGRQSARTELEAILGELLPGAELLVTDDAVSALTGGTGGGPGVLLISGTGSICLGRDGAGRTRRAGGWGHVMGDEGSGYDMARRMLRAIVRAQDGREEPTLLRELVFAHWELSTVDQLVERVYSKGKSEIASLAFLCDIGYDKGDKAARHIVKACADQLAELARAVRAGLSLPQEVPCLGAGSVLEKSACLRACLEERLGAELTPCRHGAVWGCGRLAWEKGAGEE